MDRKLFIKSALCGSAGFVLPGQSSEILSQNLSGIKPVFRFAVGGDLHYGDGDYRKNAENFVNWLNQEYEGRGLDLFFLNGDVVHDITDKYEELKEEFLSKLNMPYFAIKGNHDYLEEGQTWESIWGHPADQIVEAGPLAFIFADTSRGDNLNSAVYTSPNLNWMEQALKKVSDKDAVFIVLHIAQRKEGGNSWPKSWPAFGVGHFEYDRTDDAEKAIAMIEATPNVKAIFHGHNHNIVDSYQTYPKPHPHAKPYFFCSRLGHTWGNTIGYRIIEIYENGSARTYQYDPVSGEILHTELIEMVAKTGTTRSTFENTSFVVRPLEL